MAWDHRAFQPVPAQLNLSSEEEEAISVASVESVADANFCESVESGHSDHSHSAQIAQGLGITAAPARMDSQVHCARVEKGGGRGVRSGLCVG